MVVRFKKIVAVGSGFLLLGATMGGALAQDLSDYPKPFIQDGRLNGTIVVGEDAQTADVLGSIDIAANLQFHATEPVDVGDRDGVVTITDGEPVKQGSQYLNLGESLNEVADSFDSDDFPDLLADGEVEDDDGETYDYEQEMLLGNQTVVFGNPDDDLYDDAVAYLDFEAATQPLLSFVIEFDDFLDITELNDGETIEMFGKQLTFDQDIDDDDEITLFASEKTIFINQGETLTVEAEGREYELSVLGGNSDQDTAILQIGDETESVEGGNSETIGGLRVYVDDVFISNIGQTLVGVKLFIGSDEWTLPRANAGGNSATLELNDDDVDGVEVIVTGVDNDAVEEIRFEIDPTEFENEEIDEDYDWLVVGEEFVEPLFGFKVDFPTMSPNLKSNSNVETEIKKSGDDLVIDFVTNDGDECSLDLFTEDDNNDDITYYNDFAGVVDAGDDIEEDMYFILVEDENNDPLTRVYMVENIDSSEDEVTLNEMCSDKEITVGVGDELDDTGVEIATIAANDDSFTLDTDTISYIFTRNDMKIAWDHDEVDDGSTNSIDLNISEDINDDFTEDVVGDKSIVLTLEGDTGDDEIDVRGFSGYSGDTWESDNDIEYGMTEYGTYWERDTDDYDGVDIWYPNRDRYFNVFVAPSDAQVVVSNQIRDSIRTPLRIEPGFSALDTELSNYTGRNLIIVGGPAVNRAAASVLGLEYPAYAEDSTVPENAAIIKLLANGNGRHALLVAGWEADDTRRASTVIADHVNYDLTGREVRVTGTSMTDINVQVIQ